ncbi:MAG: hypothetical protein ACYDCO_18985 [Armatimonadota bacterium]
MAQDASAPPPARAPRKRRWRVALVVVLLIAAGAGWWWFTRPKAMRLVDVMTPAMPGMPAGQMEVRAYPEYFAVVSRQDVPVTAGSTTHIFYFRRAIALRRWNGEVTWQAHFPLPTFPQGRTPLDYAPPWHHAQSFAGRPALRAGGGGWG